MNLDDLMVINDGFCLSNTLRMTSNIKGYGGFINETSSFKTADGLGYKPTPYNMVGGMIGKGWDIEETENEEGEINIKPTDFKVLEPIELITLDVNELLNIQTMNDQILTAVKRNSLDHDLKHGDVYEIEKKVREENDNIKKVLEQMEKEKKINEQIRIENEKAILKEQEEKKKIEEEERKAEESKKTDKANKLSKLFNIMEKKQEQSIKKKFDILKELPNKYYSSQEGKDVLKNQIYTEWIRRKNANSIKPNTYSKEDLGFGKIWEDVLKNKMNKIIDTEKPDDLGNKHFKNNDEHKFYKKKLVNSYDPSSQSWVKKPLSTFLTYDLDGEKQALENKMYDTNALSVSYNDLKNDNDILELQVSKLGMYEPNKKNQFIPYFSRDGNNVVFYNLLDKDNNTWVNADYNKDLYMMYLLKDGIFELKLNNADYLPFRKSSVKDDKGNPLYVFNTDEILNNPIYKYDPKSKTIEIDYKFLRKHKVYK